MRRMIALLVTMFGLVAALPQVSQAQANATVRVMHASPDAPAVDVFVNGSAVLTNVPFFALSNRLTVPAGNYRIQVSPTGAGAASSVIDANVTLAGGTAYTIAAVNKVSSIEPLVLTDDTAAPPAGQVKVRIIHASPDAPAVDIKLAGTNTAVLSNAAFKANAYLTVPAGTYRFDITPAGESTVVFTTPELRFVSGWTYTLVAGGFLAQPNEETPGFWVQARVDNVR